MRTRERGRRLRIVLALGTLLGCHSAVPRPPAPPPFVVQSGSGKSSGPPAEIEVWPSVKRDLAHAPKRIWDDGRDVFSFSERRYLYYLLGAAAYALAAESFEDREATFFEHHTLFSTGVQDLLGALGNGLTLYAGTLAWYFWAAAHDDVQSYEASKTVFSALTVTAITTTLLKGLIHDDRPSGGTYDFPSGHASQTMALAASLDELYGKSIGWPAYGLSILVGLQRLDIGKHDTGSVVFGWVLGYVVGKTVAAKHAPCIFGMELGLSVDEDSGELGLSLSRTF